MKAHRRHNTSSHYSRTRRLIGQILIEGNFISYNDLEHALTEQKKTNKMLGEILIEMGILDPADLMAVLTINEDLACIEDAIHLAAGVRRFLGDLFVQAKHITPEQLELTLKVQKRSGKKLGEVLMRLGFVSGGELDSLLKFQQNQALTGSLPSRLRLGELLVTSHLISREQLEDALTRQKGAGKKIGKILVDAGYINQHQLSHGLRLQTRLLTAALAAILSLAPISAVHSGDVQRSGSFSEI
jgi:hypothetical protein